MADLRVQRHEEKYLLDPLQAACLRRLLDAALRRDPHCAAAPYRIRSLYFDTADDRDHQEKILGVSERQKLRLRAYDPAAEAVKLELKTKRGVLCGKQSAALTRAEAARLTAGEAEFLLAREGSAAQHIGALFLREQRRPAVLVDYRRTAWVLPVEHVRITLDERVRAAKCADLFAPAPPLVGVHSAGAVILEVKYDRFLPGYVRRMLSTVDTVPVSVSKYAAARAMLY